MRDAERLIEIYHEASARPPGAERDRFLVESCGDQIDLKEQVVSLLQFHNCAGGFLKEPIFPPTPVTSEKPGDAIGRYKLLEKLGEGGCGVVYVAEQTEPVRRRVALKVIKLGMDTKQVVARFEAERQALAMMDHPNIARVLDAGSTETGRPYFVMDLVRGLKITEYCDQNSLIIRERLDLFTKVCHAIQHAHQKGVIHRDIKPSNILVTLHDGVPVPKVIDFGIAKATEGRLAEGTIYTHFLHFVGTPAYMSPEQAEMSGLDVDTRSDIYSLGVLLYELLTGQPPFDGQTLVASGIDEMRKTIREKEPIRPSTRVSQSLAAAGPHTKPSTRHSALSTDLDWIVMKCLEKDRTRRYDTPNSLAADLNRHLNSEPVTARPPSKAYKLQKAWRRNRLAFLSAGTIAIALLAGIILSTWQAVEARRARNEAQRESLKSRVAQKEADTARKAEQAERIVAQHHSYIANINLAGGAWEENNFPMVRQLLAETRASLDRGFEWYYWQREIHRNSMAFYGHLDVVNSIAFFPDGQRFVTGSADKSARVWDWTTGKQLYSLLGHKSGLNAVAVSPDGTLIATAREKVIVWDSSSGRPVLTLPGNFGDVNAVAFSPDGRQIVTGGSDSIGRIWDLAARHVIATLNGHTNAINSVAFSPDGRKVVTAGNDCTARVWRSSDGYELFPLIGHTREILTVAFSPDGQKILTGSVDLVGQFWDALTGSKLPLQLLPEEPIASLAFSGDGRRLVTGSWSSVGRVWNATNAEVELIILGHERGVHAVAITPDGKRVVTGSADHIVKAWNADGGRQQLFVKGNTNSILGVAVSPNGERLAIASGILQIDGSVSGSGDHAVQIWDTKKKEKVLVISGHERGVSSVAFSPHGDRILTGSGDHTGRLWDATTGHRLRTFKGHAASVTSVAFYPSGDRIVTAGHDQTVRVWDTISASNLFTLNGHTGTISCVAVSPNGLRLVTGSHDCSVRVWDATTGEWLRTIHRPMDVVRSVAISPDNRRIAVAGFGTPTVYDLEDPAAEPIALHGHATPVYSITFSPDGQRIGTGSLDHFAKVWEAATGRQLLTLRGHKEFVYSVAFSPDGLRLFTGSADKTVGIWEAATPKQVDAWEAEERAATMTQAATRRELRVFEQQPGPESQP